MRAFAARLALLLAAAPFAAAQIPNRDDLTPLELHYETTVAHDLERFEIALVVERLNRPVTRLVMPSWAPGAYSIRDYGEGVRELAATGDGGAALEVLRTGPASWSVDTAGHSRLRVTYSLEASRRSRFGRRPAEGEEEAPVTGLRLSGPGTYLYVEGAKELPVRASYRVPEGWRVSNGLLPTGTPGLRWARDYDTFIDAPTILGRFQERQFEVDGTPFTCVFFENEQSYDFDIDAFVDIVRRIVEHQGALFGSFPFPNYVFQFTLPGGGGLEHLNSTSIGLRAERQKEDPRDGASVTSHEFFHTWNVKRIRPAVLGPFDYTQENYTENLWVSEGWTSYFGDLTLRRIGVWSTEEYLEHLERVIERELNKPRRKEHPVTWASRNTWHRFDREEGSRVDYYGKGELLGCLLDLRLRHLTGGETTLNDVMRFLNRWFAERGVGFEEGDIERALTALSNHDFSEFFARHVHGTLDPPLAELFAHAGVAYRAELIPCSFPFDLRGKRVSGRPEPGDEDAAEPRPGDELVSIGGEPFEDANAFLRQRAPGEVVTLTVKRGEEQRDLEVTLSDEPILIPELTLLEDATIEQVALRNAWLSSVE